MSLPEVYLYTDNISVNMGFETFYWLFFIFQKYYWKVFLNVLVDTCKKS